MPRTTMQDAGDAAEQLVADRLATAGWRILGRNLRVGRAELDILAVDPGSPPALVVIEVRRRGRNDFGFPEETVDHRKRARLWSAGCALAEAGVTPEGTVIPRLPLRLDLVAVEPGVGPDQWRIRHHRSLGHR